MRAGGQAGLRGGGRRQDTAARRREVRARVRIGASGLRADGWDESGSGSILGIGLVLALAVLMSAAAPMGGALAAHQRLQGAADSAALAAADTVSGRVGGLPCEQAAAVASALHETLLECAVTGSEATVTLGSETLGMRMSARSRAGPPPVTG